ncbi:hypothetical protein F5883DRAFT_410128, partial [Diaporthe sp. PMI_573]
NITAVIAAHLPSQEIDDSIADILLGGVNSSSKLPYTIARREADYNAPIVNIAGSTSKNAWHSDFSAPQYESGFRLSYTCLKEARLWSADQLHAEQMWIVHKPHNQLYTQIPQQLAIHSIEYRYYSV